MHNNAAVLRTIEAARRKLVQEEVRLQVQRTYGAAKDLPQLLKTLGFLPNGNLSPLPVHIARFFIILHKRPLQSPIFRYY